MNVDLSKKTLEMAAQALRKKAGSHKRAMRNLKRQDGIPEYHQSTYAAQARKKNNCEEALGEIKDIIKNTKTRPTTSPRQN